MVYLENRNKLRCEAKYGGSGKLVMHQRIHECGLLYNAIII